MKALVEHNVFDDIININIMQKETHTKVSLNASENEAFISNMKAKELTSKRNKECRNRENSLLNT